MYNYPTEITSYNKLQLIKGHNSVAIATVDARLRLISIFGPRPQLVLRDGAVSHALVDAAGVSSGAPVVDTSGCVFPAAQVALGSFAIPKIIYRRAFIWSMIINNLDIHDSWSMASE